MYAYCCAELPGAGVDADVMVLMNFFFVSVTCAKSPRQVINILNNEGGEIDIILAEVDLPVTKCFKMLKYIARNKDLRHIPIISKLPSCSLSSTDPHDGLVVIILLLMELHSDVQQRRGPGCCQVLAAWGSRVPGEAAAHERAAEPMDPCVAAATDGKGHYADSPSLCVKSML